VEDIGIHYTWLEEVIVMSTAVARYALFRNMGRMWQCCFSRRRRSKGPRMSWWLTRVKDPGVGKSAFACPTSSRIKFASFLADLPRFLSRFTPLSTLVSGSPANRSRNSSLQLPAMMPRRLMAYTNVSGGRPGWPADRQVYTHLLKARPAVVARAATRRPHYHAD
jgi:hypothetical protein